MKSPIEIFFLMLVIFIIHTLSFFGFQSILAIQKCMEMYIFQLGVSYPLNLDN